MRLLRVSSARPTSALQNHIYTRFFLLSPSYRVDSIFPASTTIRITSHGHSFGAVQQPSHQSWRPHLPIMYRLRTMHTYLAPSDCSRALSALESLGSAREIALILNHELAPDMVISDNPLPVHSLVSWVDASNHQVVKRLIQKCSQSLRQLHLKLQDDIPPPSTFLPHLYELSAETHQYNPANNEPDLMSWFPFLDQHPTITRLSLCYKFTLIVQPSLDLLPNLQFLSATPAIIERLTPGRPVDDVYAKYHCSFGCFPVDIMLRPLRQPFVPVTTLAIDMRSGPLPNDFLIKLVQTLPKLRKFTLVWTCDEVRRLLGGRRYLELTGNRFLSHYKVFCLLLGGARTWFISK